MTMDWIVTTGSTVDEALDLALDTLSVTHDDIEFEVLREPVSYTHLTLPTIYSV